MLQVINTPPLNRCVLTSSDCKKVCVFSDQFYKQKAQKERFCFQVTDIFSEGNVLCFFSNNLTDIVGEGDAICLYFSSSASNLNVFPIGTTVAEQVEIIIDALQTYSAFDDFQISSIDDEYICIEAKEAGASDNPLFTSNDLFTIFTNTPVATNLSSPYGSLNGLNAILRDESFGVVFHVFCKEINEVGQIIESKIYTSEITSYLDDGQFCFDFSCIAKLLFNCSKGYKSGIQVHNNGLKEIEIRAEEIYTGNTLTDGIIQDLNLHFKLTNLTPIVTGASIEDYCNCKNENSQVPFLTYRGEDFPVCLCSDISLSALICLPDGASIGGSIDLEYATTDGSMENLSLGSFDLFGSSFVDIAFNLCESKEFVLAVAPECWGCEEDYEGIAAFVSSGSSLWSVQIFVKDLLDQIGSIGGVITSHNFRITNSKGDVLQTEALSSEFYLAGVSLDDLFVTVSGVILYEVEKNGVTHSIELCYEKIIKQEDSQSVSVDFSVICKDLTAKYLISKKHACNPLIDYFNLSLSLNDVTYNPLKINCICREKSDGSGYVLLFGSNANDFGITENSWTYSDSGQTGPFGTLPPNATGIPFLDLAGNQLHDIWVKLGADYNGCTLSASFRKRIGACQVFAGFSVDTSGIVIEDNKCEGIGDLFAYTIARDFGSDQYQVFIFISPIINALTIVGATNIIYSHGINANQLSNQIFDTITLNNNECFSYNLIIEAEYDGHCFIFNFSNDNICRDDLAFNAIDEAFWVNCKDLSAGITSANISLIDESIGADSVEWGEYYGDCNIDILNESILDTINFGPPVSYNLLTTSPLAPCLYLVQKVTGCKDNRVFYAYQQVVFDCPSNPCNINFDVNIIRQGDCNVLGSFEITNVTGQLGISYTITVTDSSSNVIGTVSSSVADPYPTLQVDNLDLGTYTVVVSSLGCESVQTVLIGDENNCCITDSVEIANAPCQGQNGEITINASSTLGVVNIEVFDNSSTSIGTATGSLVLSLPSGNYSVTYTIGDCTESKAFTVLQDECLSPTDATTTNIGEDSAVLDWTALIDATDYEICIREQGILTWQSSVLTGGVPNYLAEGLECGKFYEFKIRSICGNCISEWTNDIGFSTLPCPSCPLPDFRLVCNNGRVDVDLTTLNSFNSNLQDGATIMSGADCNSTNSPLYELEEGSWNAVGVLPILDCVNPEFVGSTNANGQFCFEVGNAEIFDTVKISNDGDIFINGTQYCMVKPFLESEILTINQPPQQLPILNIVNSTGTLYTATITSSPIDISSFKNFINSCTYPNSALNFISGSLLLTSTAISEIVQATTNTLNIYFDRSLILSPCVQSIIDNVTNSLDNAPITTSINGLRCFNVGQCTCYFQLTKCGITKTYKIDAENAGTYKIYLIDNATETLVKEIENENVILDTICPICCPISFVLQGEYIDNLAHCNPLNLCRTFVAGDNSNCNPCEEYKIEDENGNTIYQQGSNSN